MNKKQSNNNRFQSNNNFTKNISTPPINMISNDKVIKHNSMNSLLYSNNSKVSINSEESTTTNSPNQFEKALNSQGPSLFNKTNETGIESNDYRNDIKFFNNQPNNNNFNQNKGMISTNQTQQLKSNAIGNFLSNNALSIDKKFPRNNEKLNTYKQNININNKIGFMNQNNSAGNNLNKKNHVTRVKSDKYLGNNMINNKFFNKNDEISKFNSKDLSEEINEKSKLDCLSNLANIYKSNLKNDDNRLIANNNSALLILKIKTELGVLDLEFNRNDNILQLVKVFCENNKLSDQLVNPIINMVQKSVDNLERIMSANLKDEDLNFIATYQNKINSSTDEDSNSDEENLNKSCLTENYAFDEIELDDDILNLTM